MTDKGSALADRIHELLASVVETAGVELLDVEWNGGTLRVVIDHADGVSTQALTAVNRLVSPILDQHDPISDRYVLEVSSPGVERPLRSPEHFQRAIGEDVAVKLQPGADLRRLKGRLTAVEANVITIDTVEVDGSPLGAPETHTIDLDEIDRARTVFDWGPTPKKGGKNPNKKSKKSKK